MMKGIVGLPNPGFAVCKSGDAVKQTVFAFHESEPRTKEFESFDAADFVSFRDAELDGSVIGFDDEVEFYEGVVWSFQCCYLLSFE